MPSHQLSVRIEAPPEQVFQAMTDTGRWQEWWTQIQSVSLFPGWQKGARLDCRIMGADLPGEVTAYDPPREMAFVTHLPVGGRVGQHFRFDAEENGTRLVAHIDASGMMGQMFTRNRVERELQRLKANVEARQ